jgi:hypothetical protein
VHVVDAAIDVNLKGQIYGMKAVAPVMVRQRAGHIVNRRPLRARGGARRVVPPAEPGDAARRHRPDHVRHRRAASPRCHGVYAGHRYLAARPNAGARLAAGGLA